MRQYTADFEPAATQPFDDLWERKLTSVQQVKGEKNDKLVCRATSDRRSRTVVDGLRLFALSPAICNIVVYSIIFYLVFSLSSLSSSLVVFFSPTEEMHKFIAEQLQTGRVPLCINPQSAAFKSFAR